MPCSHLYNLMSRCSIISKMYHILYNDLHSCDGLPTPPICRKIHQIVHPVKALVKIAIAAIWSQEKW
jgi:hypothetical protein